MKGINLGRQRPRETAAKTQPTTAPRSEPASDSRPAAAKGCVYLDNAATTYPKPDAVYRWMDAFFRQSGVSPDRGTHRLAREAVAETARARGLVARLLNVSAPDRVVFTRGATESLNLAIRGLVRPGDHVVTTTIEHNSVIRPLASLQSDHVDVVRVAPDGSGVVTAAAIEERLTPWTKLIVMTHASNVTGVVQPIEEVARLAHGRGIRLIVDAAQTAGCWPIDASIAGIAAVAFSGHKGVYGPPGVGVLWLAPSVDPLPLLFGGTGSHSESEQQPSGLPARYEAGTINFTGIAGLAAGIEHVLAQGVEKIRDRHRELMTLLASAASSVPGLTLHAVDAPARTGVQSLLLEGYEPSDLAAALDQSFDIAVRSGLHCSPGLHRQLGTAPAGTVRASVSSLTTNDDILALVDALRKLAAAR